MLVLTVQDKVVLQKLGKGEYKADFWKSRCSCMSPRFTKGYRILEETLHERTGDLLYSPVFAWGGAPFIESIKDNGNKQVLFLDVPERELVFSDYDKFCDYVTGVSGSTDFLLSRRKAKDRIKRGYCVQVCMSCIKPEWLVSYIDYSWVDKYDGTVDDFYRYCSLLNSYFLLSE